MTTEFALGQRWVSHADVELGLGIVVEVDPRRVTVHFPAVGEDRTYATDRAPLTRLALKSGDLLNRVDGEQFTVTDVEHHDGVLVYKVEENNEITAVSELELDSHIQLSSPKDRLLNNQLDKIADFKLRFATLQHRASAESVAFRGLLGARTSLLSHQMFIAHEVGRRFAPRVLLADEVGLGKTIEAGLILNQQLLTGRAQRALIMVPDALIHQWLVEMLRRFNLHFSLFDAERLADIDDASPFETEQLILCPFSLFSDHPNARALAMSVNWDIVVVDEAHHLNHASAEEDRLYDFVEALSGLPKGLLLLTATPEQAGVESHFARLRLLDAGRFSSIDEFLEEQRHYAEWNTVIDSLLAGSTADHLPEGVDTDATPSEQIDQLLDRYGTGRVLFRNTRASVPGFPVRTLHSYPLELPEGYADHKTELYPELSTEESTWLAKDPRVHWLETTLRELRPQKVLVICANAQTALALEQYLHLQAGIRCAAFHEGLTLVERDRAAAYFAEEEGGAQALICSEIGSEGRNFQFAHHLICFDLPLNPDLVEQRIGRLDRIGQESAVNIHVPWLKNSAQAVLFQWLDEGLAAFTHSSAVGHAVYSEFEMALHMALETPDSDHAELMQATRHFRQALESEMQAGRDKLLELNSHRPDVGLKIIAAVEDHEAPGQIEEFAELLFDRIGIDQDYHAEGSYVLRPSERMITGQLPALGEEGTTITFDRQRALARDDMVFLTWEHPLIREAIDIVVHSELGNATLGTLKHSKIKPGSVLLEAIFTIDCIAPAHLELGRFVDLAPHRFVISSDGKNVAQGISHEALNQLIQPVPAATSANVIRSIKAQLERQIEKAETLAREAMAGVLEIAQKEMQESLESERERLLFLKSVNPSVRQDEIDAIEARITDSARAISGCQLQQQALRVVIAT
ncbi:RNA polymerase-associated protein HepA [Luminiphilus syltensis NOR5-1B]|uniref:RNA polymerase-associated protein RapA n=1 Tax=Luminiphilus syltensis NOR5-1B TaxID=565045 RepID=B8KQZ7_9GAMM|nr:RNA polymerase-associated protein RapA [Luminiphilus syltensis]EED35996.1 RNA polymerase-associated protein HepA [Luminiphilus syltensis NOR5-1B]